jgi:hypothetical protein
MGVIESQPIIALDEVTGQEGALKLQQKDESPQRGGSFIGGEGQGLRPADVPPAGSELLGCICNGYGLPVTANAIPVFREEVFHNRARSA